MIINYNAGTPDHDMATNINDSIEKQYTIYVYVYIIIYHQRMASS